MKRKYNYCIRNYNKLFNGTEEEIRVKLEKIKRETEKRIKEKEDKEIDRLMHLQRLVDNAEDLFR